MSNSGCPSKLKSSEMIRITDDRMPHKFSRDELKEYVEQNSFATYKELGEKFGITRDAIRKCFTDHPRSRVNICLNSDLYNNIKNISYKTRLPKIYHINMAVKQYIEKMELDLSNTNEDRK